MLAFFVPFFGFFILFAWGFVRILDAVSKENKIKYIVIYVLSPHISSLVSGMIVGMFIGIMFYLLESAYITSNTFFIVGIILIYLFFTALSLLNIYVQRRILQQVEIEKSYSSHPSSERKDNRFQSIETNIEQEIPTKDSPESPPDHSE